MNTHRRYQTVVVFRGGEPLTVTRTVRNIKTSDLLTQVGETTFYGETLVVEQSEDGKQWREIRSVSKLPVTELALSDGI